ncbi:alkaline phosphatase family protein [Halococcus hamelinensis]|uniref:Sulfatase N-terminal domain-containing protein n=1 Tax=Halococcus hamelinensis 100A6 TaxID=1132509 RepID=M0M365_9EURY|nr:hypothetical protein [Halococcus hamelinensis]EMA38835.1 hypothetical protein C447_08433 [Halococcus hamelinensis 100A6]
MDVYSRITPERLRRGIETPALIGRELNRFYHTRFETRPHNTAGIDVFAEDWDTLAIADACPLSTFATHHTLPGQLETRVSRGSSTPEWLEANFTGDQRDTVYITANPQYERNRDDLDIRLCEVENVWDSEGWDAEYRTVRPETVTDAVLDAADRYPNKRLLVHYIQPHYPFIGPTGQRYFDGDSLSFWSRVMDGSVNAPDHVLSQAHDENFKLMLPALERLLDERDGKTVVTADHGQMLGQRSFPIPIREWGHPRETYVDELVHVPWLVHETGTRPDITKGDATEAVGHSDDDLSERLAALGYAD